MELTSIPMGARGMGFPVLACTLHYHEGAMARIQSLACVLLFAVATFQYKFLNWFWVCIFFLENKTKIAFSELRKQNKMVYNCLARLRRCHLDRQCTYHKRLGTLTQHLRQFLRRQTLCLGVTDLRRLSRCGGVSIPRAYTACI